MLKLPNGVYVIEGDTHHRVWCETEGLVHDKWMAQQIGNIIRKRCVKSCVDGGANIGTLTQAMFDAGAREVHAFEPNPKAASCLRANCPKATVYEVGLSDTHETRFFAALPNAGASFIEPGIAVEPEKADTKVTLWPLDNYNTHKPGLIKLDLEGYEVQALAGARETIARYRPVIICEINPHHLARYGNTPHDVFSWLSARNYRFHIMQPNLGFEADQYDIVAYP